MNVGKASQNIGQNQNINQPNKSSKILMELKFSRRTLKTSILCSKKLRLRLSSGNTLSFRLNCIVFSVVIHKHIKYRDLLLSCCVVGCGI